MQRTDILDRLRGQIARRIPLVGAGCSSGLIARAAAAGGADIIVVYNTGRSRLMGLPTNHLLNHANPTTLGMYREIANVVRDVPIVGGAEAGDPTYYSDLDRLVDDFRSTGFSGVINFPGAAANPRRNRARSAVGLGFDREVQLIRIAREQDFFTMAYAYDHEAAKALAAAGCDVIVPHAGWTSGGDIGSGSSTLSLEQSYAHVQELVEVARAEQPDVIVLAHGGAIATANDTQELYDRADVQGFLGASSIERLPVEIAIRETVGAYRALTLPTAKDAS
jgi:predicted TIM-barrel enzyme